jgi:Mg2+ and Co2+ transporter CorA
MEAMTGFSEQNIEFLEYRDTLEDFTALKNRLEGCRSRIDSLMRTVIGAGSLIVSQNSLSQADSAARISFLAIAFLPFSFAASMFTMPDSYSPGQEHFWIYWVVSFLLIFIIVVIVFIMNWSRYKL